MIALQIKKAIIEKKPDLLQKEITNRKGARKVQDIPKEVLELLNLGKIEN